MPGILNRSTTIPVEVWQDETMQPRCVTPITDSIFFSYFEALNKILTEDSEPGATTPVNTVQLTADELTTLANIHMNPPAPADSLVMAVRKRLAQD